MEMVTLAIEKQMTLFSVSTVPVPIPKNCCQVVSVVSERSLLSLKDTKTGRMHVSVSSKPKLYPNKHVCQLANIIQEA